MPAQCPIARWCVPSRELEREAIGAKLLAKPGKYWGRRLRQAEAMTAGRQSTPRGLPAGAEAMPSRIERALSLLILAVLAAIAFCVFRVQFSFNPAVQAALESAQPVATPQPRARAATAAWVPSELEAAGVAERFTPDNLYDKIDGKAELYLAAGFVQMHCQRFTLKARPDQWLEWFVYEQGSLPQAFSVYSTQRRPDGQPLALTEYAYRTRNALYFVCGRDYVEAIASEASESLMRAGLALAAHFLATQPPSGPLPELGLFPAANLVAGSHALQCADAFGFGSLSNVFTARYRVEGTEVMAFVTGCADPSAAAALRDAYVAFLVANGGTEVPAADGPGKRIQIMDGTELVFAEASFVGGIHSARSSVAAARLAQLLRQRLSAVPPAAPSPSPQPRN